MEFILQLMWSLAAECLRTPGECKSKTCLSASLPVVSVFDIEEEEGACHEHAQDSDGRQDAVKWYIDMAAL